MKTLVNILMVVGAVAFGLICLIFSPIIFIVVYTKEIIKMFKEEKNIFEFKKD